MEGPSRKRLRCKTPPLHRRQQEPVAELEDFAATEDRTARRQVYLVTLPHTNRATTAEGLPLCAPETRTKQQVLDAFRDSCADPLYVDVKSPMHGSRVDVDRVVVFAEFHTDADKEGVVHLHYHLAVRSSAKFRFLPVKRALVTRHGLASHWSCHDGYWSAVRYCFWPSPKKPDACLDKEPLCWAKEQLHPPLKDGCVQTSAVIDSRKISMLCLCQQVYRKASSDFLESMMPAACIYLCQGSVQRAYDSDSFE